MGRKRKTRWRRLSIGEISGNEEDGEEMTGGVGTLTRSLSSSQNHSPAHKPYLNSNNNHHHHNYHSSSNMTKGETTSSTSPPNNSSTHLSDSPKKSSGLDLPLNNGSTPTNPSSPNSNHTHQSNGGSGYGYNNGHYNQGHYANHHHQYESHYDRYHYHKDNYRPPSYYNGEGGTNYDRGGSSERGGYHGSGSHHKDYHGYQGVGYHGSGYRGSNGYNGSYNRNSSYNNSSGNGGSSSTTGSEGYNNGDYYSHNGHHPPSRSYGPGRFRRSRSYPASNYYYTNGSGGGAGSNCDNTNKPSYNQEEYTKITTPRQDVLFKKGYLSQKKPQSSVESASTTTTPTASTNGTPDTQSTNGINSDYSEGYENGETDCVIPYDASYYYPPPEAVFTDPTGQVYYGHCSSNGEYYDAYPVSSPMMVAGYPAMYYPVPYPVDWNGVPIPYPMVAVPPQIPSHSGPHIEEIMDLPALQGGETTLSESTGGKSDTTPPTLTSSSSSSETESPLSSPTEQSQGSSSSSDNKVLTTPPPPKSNSNSSSCLSEEKGKVSGESSSPKSPSSSPAVCPAPNEPKDGIKPQLKKEQKMKTSTSGDKDNNNLSKSPTKEKSAEPSLSKTQLPQQQPRQQQFNKLKQASSKDSSSSSMSSPSSSVPVSPPGASGTTVPKTGAPVTTYASAVGNANVHSNSHPPQQHLGPSQPQPHPHSMNNGQHFQHPGGPRYHHPHPQQMGHHGPHNGYQHHGPPPQQHQHQLPPPPPHMAMSGPPPLPPYMYHPHPPIPGAGFVYGPPVYNGVAPASADTVSSSPSCRKKRKKRRKEKDKEKDGGQDDDNDGQLTDEASSTSTTEYPESERTTFFKNLNSTKNLEQKSINLIKKDDKKEKSPDFNKAPGSSITPMQIETNAEQGKDSASKNIIRSSSTTSSSSLEDRGGDHSNPNSPTKQLAARKEIIEPLEDSEDSGWTIASNNKSRRNKKFQTYKYKSPPPHSEMKEKRGGVNSHHRLSENSYKPLVVSPNSADMEVEKSSVASTLPPTTKADEASMVSNVIKKKCNDDQGKKKMVSLEPSSTHEPESVETDKSSALASDTDKSAQLQNSSPVPAADPVTDQVVQVLPAIESSVTSEVEGFSSKKPADLDLTLQSEVEAPTNNYDYEFLLPKEPAPEPSSPSDSLNTNQSMAGSEEVAAISISESDLLNMNRTTSLDEVEEDLPEEEEVAVVELLSRQETTDKIEQSNPNTTPALPVKEEVSPVIFLSTPGEQLGTKEKSSEPKGHVMEGLEREVNEIEKQSESQLSPALSLPLECDMQKEKETLVSPESNVGLVEQEKENVTDLGHQLFSQVEEKLEKVAMSQEENLEATQVPPKSLTLVVSEWLKAQGDGALTVTPIGPGSGEEGDADLSEDDDDEDEYDEDFEGDGSNATRQDQKNGLCNPWAVSSNKKNYKDDSTSSPRVACSHHHSSLASTSTTPQIGDAIKSVNQTTKAIHQNRTTCSNQEKSNNGYSSTTKNINYDSGYELSSPEEQLMQEESISRRKNHRKSLEKENVDHHHKLESKESGQAINPSAIESQFSTQSFTMDESNPTEICDPQKFSKYYQFGVVFDPDPDKSIFDSEDGEKKKEMDSEDHLGDKETDFLTVMMKTNKNLERKQSQPKVHSSLPTTIREENGAKVVLLRGRCDQDDDEEIGTFDPDAVAQQKRNRRFLAQFEERAEDVSNSDQFRTGVSSPSNNIYVNPMSLARELVDYSNLSGDALSASWDVDSEALPEYESPPPENIPVYNSTTPQHRLIQRKLTGTMMGDPVPSGICCSIQ